MQSNFAVEVGDLALKRTLQSAVDIVKIAEVFGEFDDQFIYLFIIELGNLSDGNKFHFQGTYEKAEGAQLLIKLPLRLLRIPFNVGEYILTNYSAWEVHLLKHIEKPKVEIVFQIHH
jgi:hypothetical protein